MSAEGNIEILQQVLDSPMTVACAGSGGHSRDARQRVYEYCSASGASIPPEAS